MEINLSQKQSNAYHFLEDKVTNEVLYGGAAGGGKSFFGCLWQINRRQQYAGTRGLIGRSKLTNLKQSTLKTFFEVSELMGYKIDLDYKYNGQSNTITYPNGSEIILKDLFLYPSDPDFTSLGSTEFTDAFIDEAPEISMKAFDIVNSRLRYKISKYGLVPKILLTANPQKGWLKERYIANELNERVHLEDYQKFVSASVDDNPDEEFKKIYKQRLQRMSNDYDVQRLLYGNWDIEDAVDSPFLLHFDNSMIQEVSMRPNERVIISIDFNNAPFCISFWHVKRVANQVFIDCFDTWSIPKCSTPEVIEKLKKDPIYSKKLGTCYITGDYSGSHGSTAYRQNKSHFSTIRTGLRLGSGQIKIKPNPRHKKSRDDCNSAMFLRDTFIFRFDKTRCKPLIRDCKIVQYNEDKEQIIKANRSKEAEQADQLDTLRSVVDNFVAPHLVKFNKYGKLQA